MLMGPPRLRAYSSPIAPCSNMDWAMVLSDAPALLPGGAEFQTDRICRWSCRLAPTPAGPVHDAMLLQTAWPMPRQSCKISGEPMLPAHRSLPIESALPFESRGGR
jgi:hypothetical protein